MIIHRFRQNAIEYTATLYTTAYKWQPQPPKLQLHFHVDLPQFWMSMAATLLFVALPILVRGCSNILVTSGASQDGNILVGDNDDSSRRHGLVTHFDGGHHPGIICPVLICQCMGEVMLFVQKAFSSSLPQVYCGGKAYQQCATNVCWHHIMHMRRLSSQPNP